MCYTDLDYLFQGGDPERKFDEDAEVTAALERTEDNFVNELFDYAIDLSYMYL